MNKTRDIHAYLLGAASSLAASGILALWGAAPVTITAVCLMGFAMVVLAALRLRHRILALRRMGIVNWEASMSSGTTTLMCVNESQTSLRFLGIAASKWLANTDAFRHMLQRHISNGGRAQFLILHPASDECRKFELIQNLRPGTLSDRILRNVRTLLGFRSERFRVEVRFYTGDARFRIAVIDERIMLVGLYSYATHSGEDTPQLVLDSSKLPWSFYYAMNAYYLSLWESATDAEEVLMNLRQSV